MNFTTKDYARMAHERKYALSQICETLGEAHPITKMLGSLAWGRSEFETGAEPTLRKNIREMSAYDGMFNVLNRWARDNDTYAQRTIIRLYPQTWAAVADGELAEVAKRKKGA
jgi:hypothetical protein